MQQTAIFMTYSLFFQVADTFAAPFKGFLRGYKDTTVPFLLGVFSYWCISIPLGIFLIMRPTLVPMPIDWLNF